MNASALITGGAKRIGRAIALALAGRGCDIALHYNTSRREAEALAREIESAGRTCHLLQADLNDVRQVFALAERAFEAFGNLSILINNASIFERAGLAETDEDLFDRHFNINFKAPFFLSRQFARRCQKGQIVNLIDAKVVDADNITSYFAYTLSKKALLAFTELAAKALAPRIRVNGVAPGLILPAKGQKDESFKKMIDKVPLRRKGDEQDVVRAVLFLLENDYVTGQCIFADGGGHII